MRFQIICCWLVLVIMLLSGVAHAATLADSVGRLELVPLSYGVNIVKVGALEVMIVRGDFNAATAAGGDIYTIMAHEGGRWKVARYEADTAASALTMTVPHTYEDSLLSVRFLKSQATAVPELYVLQASRQRDGAYSNATKVDFTLFALRRDDDFGIYYLRPQAVMQTTRRYCNADWALHQELGLALPEDDPAQYVCHGQP